VQRLRLLTGGESHGMAVTAILSGVPAGLAVPRERLAKELARRRKLGGRSRRMKLEADAFTCEGGLRGGVTTGNPLVLRLPNAEAEQWARLLHPFEGERDERITIPRQGHADLAGALKFAEIGEGRLRPADMRDVWERASARETAARVLAGGVCKLLLKAVGVSIASFAYQLGKVSLPRRSLLKLLNANSPDALPLKAIEASPLRMPEAALEERALAEIESAQKRGTTLGGAFAAMAFGLPPGLGSFAQWDERLDGRLAQAVMSIPAVKSVALGAASLLQEVNGSQYHDLIERQGGGVTHTTNHAGGVTGGITNGMPVGLTAFIKPIPTQQHPHASVNLDTGKPAKAPAQRSDITAVPAAAVVAEAMVALVLADAVLAEFGGSHISEVVRRVEERRKLLSRLFL
jgi:chorismate synthase